MKTLALKTTNYAQMLEITEEIQRLAGESKWKDGLVTVFVPHTTAGVTIQENADPDVKTDFLKDLERVAPWEQSYYKHAEGNSAAHFKASLMGSSVQVILAGGQLQLGTWQGVYFCEFDGPRSRKVWVSFVETR